MDFSVCMHFCVIVYVYYFYLHRLKTHLEHHLMHETILQRNPNALVMTNVCKVLSVNLSGSIALLIIFAKWQASVTEEKRKEINRKSRKGRPEKLKTYEGNVSVDG